MKIAATGSVPKNLPPHNFGKPRNVSRLVLGGESKPQPRRAGRHRRWTDRDDEEAAVAQKIGCSERRGRIADDHRDDRALRFRQIERAGKSRALRNGSPA